MKTINIVSIYTLLLCLSFDLLAHIQDKTVPPPPVGNFSMPSVTQISPLISFGQLLISKNTLFPQLSGSYTQSNHGYTNTIAPNVIYGILDNLSITFFAPFTTKSRSFSSTSSGIDDLSLQLEYGYFSKATLKSSLQATIVGAVYFPTGSSSKNPPTGTGSFSYLLGTTLAYLSSNWYAFLSPGAFLTMSHHGTKFGNSFLYEWGFARCLNFLSSKKCISNLMIEFDGTYSRKNKIDGITNPNSGGNTLLITPSINLSFKRALLQLGTSFPAIQNLNGHQNKPSYAIAYNLGISFPF